MAVSAARPNAGGNNYTMPVSQGPSPARDNPVPASAVTAAPATDEVIPAGATDTVPSRFSAPEVTPARKSFVDITAHTCFSHAADYSTLAGQVQISRLSKGVRLRYASVDEVDPYGGSVTLVEDVRLANLSDGQYVRVTGRLLNPDASAIAPPYQIDSILPLDKRD